MLDKQNCVCIPRASGKEANELMALYYGTSETIIENVFAFIIY